VWWGGFFQVMLVERGDATGASSFSSITVDFLSHEAYAKTNQNSNMQHHRCCRVGDYIQVLLGHFWSGHTVHS
jgi:hypothetical protein